MKSEVVVIGGGPAGLLCAATAARRGKSVVLFDKNEKPGRKLRITGKGRCNLTNAADISDFIAAVPTNPAFLYSAFYTCTNEDVMRLFQELGVRLKTERGGRVFPVSDSAHEIADALSRYARESGAVLQRDTVQEVLAAGGAVTGVKTKKQGVVEAQYVAIATGGASYPRTGSTGDGYRFAARLGHTVVPPQPSLIPLTAEEAWVRDLQGVSLKNVAIKLYCQNRCVYEDFGEMLFTHFGVSGPVILSASAHLKHVGERYRLEIDLKPALSFEQLDKRIQRDFEKYMNKNFSNALDDLLPRRLIDVVIARSGIPPETKVHQISRAQRHALCTLLKQFSLTVNGVRPIEEAIITRGGIAVKEVDPSTMQSKLVRNLYFCGEVLDVDAYTGGYNLQIAFSTGYLCGQSLGV